MVLTSRPDHVAIAVPAIEPALERWCGTLGGRELWSMHTPAVFRLSVVGYRNGTRMEVLEPSDATERTLATGGPRGFLEAFLDRFGPRVHHVTLKVDDLVAALSTLEAAGIGHVDLDTSDPHWQEAFIPPSTVGGLVVQLAQTDHGPVDWAAEGGGRLPPVPSTGARLLGPQLQHDDLGRAATVWSHLGGTVDEVDDGLLVSWPDDPLTVAIAAGSRPEALGLRFLDTGPRPGDDVLGPAVLARPG